MPKLRRCVAWRSTPTEPTPLQFVKRLVDEAPALAMVIISSIE
jgi:hypothetical protein